MKTYLLTWNRDNFPFEELSETAEKVKQGIQWEDRWSCANRQVELGDRIFLLKQSEEPRGLMASGYVTQKPFPDAHYDEEKAAQGKEVWYIDFIYDVILNPEKDSLLHTSTLQQKILNGPSKFIPQSSGNIINPDAASEIEKLWVMHLKGIGIELDEIQVGSESSGFEGKKNHYFTIHRSRESKLRAAKVKEVAERSGGELCCEVPRCGFNFREIYGDKGKDYAQVHHLIPLAEVEGVRLTLLSDLLGVCANCHAMIHRGGECRDYLTLIP